jgi:hypothetical protein
MPSPCSLRLAVIRSYHATEVQALRPAPLPLAAGEVLKITGASRRSAAPGSQKVCAAEYGGDLCGLQQSWSARTKGRILGPRATMRIATSFPPSAQALASANRTPTAIPPIRRAANPRTHTRCTIAVICAILCRINRRTLAAPPTVTVHPLPECRNATSLKNGG